MRHPLRRLLAAATVAACAAVAFGSVADAQTDAGRFERTEREAGLSIPGGVRSSAWGDADGDGDPDLALIDDDGVLQVFVNDGEGQFEALDLDVDTSTLDLATVRWLDVDGDGDHDLITTDADQGAAALMNTGLAFELAGAFSNARVLSHQALEVDGDGLADLYVGAAEGPGSTDSGILVRRDLGYAAAAIADFEPVEDQRLAALYRAEVDGALELYSGGPRFPFHYFLFSSAGPRYLGELTVGDTFVRDVLHGDFDGDLVSEMMLVRADIGSAITQSEDETELTFVLSAEDSVTSVVIGGSPTLDVEVLDQTGVPTFAIQFGRERVQADSYEFTLDDTLGDGTNVIRGVDAGLFINSRDDDRYRFVLAGTDRVSVQIRVTGELPIEMVQSVGLSAAGGALFDSFYQRLDDENWTRGQRLPISTECGSGAAGDFDNDTDLDVYLACGNAIEKTENVLFLNRGGGEFRFPPLGEAGQLLEVPTVTGVSMADVDSDGVLDLFVQSGGGFGIAARSALLMGQPTDRHWFGVELVPNSPSGAVGAAVVIESGEVRQRRDALGGVRGPVQDDARLHFGLGDEETVERITVHWPSGVVQVLDDVAADQYLRIVEADTDSPFAELRLEEVEVEPVVREGDRLTISVSAANLGTKATSGASLQFSLPNGWAMAADPDAGVTVEGQLVTTPLDDVAAGESIVRTLDVVVNSASGRGELIVRATGDHPTNSITVDVVTGTSSDRRFGSFTLVLILLVGTSILGIAAWMISRRR